MREHSVRTIRPKPAAERLRFAEIATAQPRGEEGGLRGILGPGVTPEDGVGVSNGGVLVPPDEFSEGFSRLGVGSRAAELYTGQLTHL